MERGSLSLRWMDHVAELAGSMYVRFVHPEMS